jgi:hypothetical protein
VVRGLLNDELETAWKEPAPDLSEVLLRNLPEGTEENHKKKVRIGDLAGIRNKHIQNTNLERYRYTNLLGTVCGII